MGDLQRKRKSNCSVPDVATILKDFELNKRKRKVNKNIVKSKPITRVKSKLKTNTQSKNSVFEVNKPNASFQLIRKTCSQLVPKTSHQDKKVWQPPIKTLSQTDASVNPSEYYDNEFNFNEVETSRESTENCHTENNKSSFEQITENERACSPTNFKVNDKKISNSLFVDTVLIATNGNKECNKNINAMSCETIDYHRSCKDNSMNDGNICHVENELTASILSACTQYIYDDNAVYNTNSPNLEIHKNTCTEFTQTSKKTRLEDCLENIVDTSEEHIINTSSSFEAAQAIMQYSYQQIQETCLNSKSQTKTRESCTKYDEYDDEDITITHSQLKHIENEFSKNKNSTDTKICSDSTKQSFTQSIPLQDFASPSFKINWNKKIEDDGKKLRQIVQELRKINESLLKMRNELWPSRNDFSSVQKIK